MRIGSVSATLLSAAVMMAGVTLNAPPAAAAPAPAPALATSDAGTLTSTVDGTFTDDAGRPGTVAGTFDPTHFAVQDGQLVATGTLHAVLTDATGATRSTESVATIPVRIPSGDQAQALPPCPILHLELGPLDLNLLGLVVHLDRVVLDITAHPGPGDLLGNLLCAIAGLLNGPNPLLGLIADLLNQVLAILGR
ncbi:hypothetical protein EV385_6586 [Krasilnikovia cinnamomea]|uniref:Uncharacterized protein n=1 Tax=Krasilnikovia cinnamomea TaxID=349313 RepID=A0A4Q7ZUG8_9ACTN|nr:hypothetical protein [Krasilnikovia cinnamomea]RZU54634.1 hypothetical protein EV385_6586 [Krasilnikovia cinnamomea]